MLSSFFGRLDLAVKHPHSLGHASVGGRCTQQSTIVSKRAEKRTIKSKLWISFLVYNFLPGLSPPKKLYGSSLSVLSLIKSPPLHLLSRPRLFLVDCCVVFIVRGSSPSDITCDRQSYPPSLYCSRRRTPRAYVRDATELIRPRFHLNVRSLPPHHHPSLAPFPLHHPPSSVVVVIQQTCHIALHYSTHAVEDAPCLSISYDTFRSNEGPYQLGSARRDACRSEISPSWAVRTTIATMTTPPSPTRMRTSARRSSRRRDRHHRSSFVVSHAINVVVVASLSSRRRRGWHHHALGGHS
jgi:hypothetical protein